MRPWFAPTRATATRLGLEVLSATPAAVTPWKRQVLPGSWGTLADVPCSPTPPGPPVFGHIASQSVGLAFWQQQTIGPGTMCFRGSITRPIRSLSTLRRAGRPNATQDSLPAAGLSLAGRDFHPLGSSLDFQGLSPSCRARLGLAHVVNTTFSGYFLFFDDMSISVEI